MISVDFDSINTYPQKSIGPVEFPHDKITENPTASVQQVMQYEMVTTHQTTTVTLKCNPPRHKKTTKYQQVQKQTCAGDKLT